MSVKFSFSCNASNFPSAFSSPYNVYCEMHVCMSSTVGSSGILVFSGIQILLFLPLNIYILYLGWQRWQRWSSGSTMSHTDLFTYHIAFMELLSVLGSILLCCGIQANIPLIEIPGFLIFSATTSGQMFFHTLTCVERYLAVVHPITYLVLRTANGVRIKTISIGCVWLLAVFWINLMYLNSLIYTVIYFCVTGLTFIFVSFCCFSVLCILNGPGPADRVGGRQHIDQSKLRALYTIEAIMGALLLRFGGSVLAATLYLIMMPGEAEDCAIMLSVFWFSLPSSLVSPLLCLHREGKLSCRQRNSESGRGSD